MKNHFYRGGELETIEGAEALKKHGVKTIISAITPTDLERELADKFKLNLVEVEFSDASVSKEDLDLFLKTLDEKTGPFYVHCHGGVHRGGTLGLAYRMIKQNWGQKKAEKEFISLGGSPDEDAGLIASVASYKEKYRVK